jgi:hypothetical protein
VIAQGGDRDPVDLFVGVEGGGDVTRVDRVGEAAVRLAHALDVLVGKPARYLPYG